MVSIVKAYTVDDFKQVRNLFIEYAESLDINLEFQNFEEELKNIPGKYESPEGCILVAMHEGQPAGCVALRKIDKDICEMKRLYVKPNLNGKGTGRALASSIIKEAKQLDYHFMRLDTLSKMKPAISLYESLGFYRIEPYRFNPIEGALYLELDLLNK
ncbi:GNAT family N-acetyltransferase [Gottfriedia acidiceleris]|uniref:GNAT family N-acetyltransferase n=1 Tax=Gottfriedia acidiceleris TaxID=371036 RepID=UPI003D2242A8